MGKFSYTWSIMGASWEVLKRDKKLLLFPLLSGLCCLIVLGSFAAVRSSARPSPCVSPNLLAHRSLLPAGAAVVEVADRVAEVKLLKFGFSNRVRS
jgi:hypothetical protein